MKQWYDSSQLCQAVWCLCKICKHVGVEPLQPEYSQSTLQVFQALYTMLLDGVTLFLDEFCEVVLDIAAK